MIESNAAQAKDPRDAFKAKFGVTRLGVCPTHKDEPLAFYCKTHQVYVC